MTFTLTNSTATIKDPCYGSDTNPELLETSVNFADGEWDVEQEISESGWGAILISLDRDHSPESVELVETGYVAVDSGQLCVRHDGSDVVTLHTDGDGIFQTTYYIQDGEIVALAINRS